MSLPNMESEQPALATEWSGIIMANPTHSHFPVHIHCQNFNYLQYSLFIWVYFVDMHVVVPQGLTPSTD